jgi:hypothetical protein
MSEKASKTQRLDEFGRVRSSIHPEKTSIPVRVLQNWPLADPPRCAAVSKAKKPGFSGPSFPYRPRTVAWNYYKVNWIFRYQASVAMARNEE